LTKHSPQREQLLQRVWAGFLVIAEAALAGAFKSDYLELAGVGMGGGGDVHVRVPDAAPARMKAVACDRGLG
jgi:hypothetical protein